MGRSPVALPGVALPGAGLPGAGLPGAGLPGAGLPGVSSWEESAAGSVRVLGSVLCSDSVLGLGSILVSGSIMAVASASRRSGSHDVRGPRSSMMRCSSVAMRLSRSDSANATRRSASSTARTW
ncbi:MAG: hypothetical protein GEV11_04035 [Streptosporangiales bacterium]|nr:hypothetical protein [Streptosporangiales bacterium]